MIPIVSPSVPSLIGPLHYYATTLDPNRLPFDSTPAMRAGTLAHCVILEPEQVAKRFVMRPAGLDLRTKEGKAWAADVQPGRYVVTEEQMLTAQRQAASIRALPEIASLLASGRAESSAFAVDPETGVLLKCRPDWYSAAGEGHIIVDIKTTQDASPDGFPRSLAKFGYHLQAVHYVDVFERATGVPVLGFVFACVESDWPHAAAAYTLDDESMEKARAENRRLTDQYAACKQSGLWSGYPNTIQPIALPQWA